MLLTGLRLAPQGSAYALHWVLIGLGAAALAVTTVRPVCVIAIAAGAGIVAAW
jgi:hypothetical protein